MDSRHGLQPREADMNAETTGCVRIWHVGAVPDLEGSLQLLGEGLDELKAEGVGSG